MGALALAITMLGLGLSPAPRAQPQPADVAERVATCRQAALGTPPLPPTVVHWPEYDDALEFAVEEDNGLYTVKLAAIVRGSRPVTVSVVPAQRDKAALLYGGRRTATTVHFEPCEGRKATGWPGGLRIERKRPVRVEIRIPGRRPFTRVLLD